MILFVTDMQREDITKALVWIEPARHVDFTSHLI
jgi:hypothetical protein